MLSERGIDGHGCYDSLGEVKAGSLVLQRVRSAGMPQRTGMPGKGLRPATLVE